MTSHLKALQQYLTQAWTAWMEYLYENQAKPTNATGVPVSLSAIDPNGNLVTIGTTTSDINGNYGLALQTRCSRNLPDHRQLRRL